VLRWRFSLVAGRKFILFAVALGLSVFSINYAYSAGGNVQNTKHNLSKTGGQNIHAVTLEEVCIFCHTPHRALTAGPLWNHTMSTRASYTVYASPTLLSPAPAGNKPDGDSLLCLSCHDGDQPVGAVQNVGGLPTTISMTGTNLSAGKLVGPTGFGSNLSGHHPVSIEINSCLINDKTNLGTGGCPDSNVDWKIDSVANIALSGPDFLKRTANKYTNGGCNSTNPTGVQCSSCHDAHSSNAKFLRTGAIGSWSTGYTDALCSVCHIPC
jgi:hypothetical protein